MSYALTRCTQLNIPENQQQRENFEVQCDTGEVMVSTQGDHALHASITENQDQAEPRITDLI